MDHRIACVALALCFTAPVQAQAQPNLAYDDGFVWYVSGRLASDFVTLQAALGVKVPVEHHDEFKILYHRYLVDCKGPLPALAQVLIVDLADQTRSRTADLAYVGAMESEIWPIVQRWNKATVLPLIETYRSGAYGFFPDCVVEGYRLQNPLPEARSR
jgi:hypothetical protein